MHDVFDARTGYAYPGTKIIRGTANSDSTSSFDTLFSILSDDRRECVMNTPRDVVRKKMRSEAARPSVSILV